MPNLQSGSTRGGHSHRCCSHSCDWGQEAVKGSKAVFGVGQAVKDISNSVTAVKMFTFCACILHIVCGQTVKVPFAVRSSSQATKTMVKIF